MTRRSVLQAALAASGMGALRSLGLTGAASAGLVGCGFALRSATTLSFERVLIEGAPASTSIGQELRRQLGGRVRFVDDRAQAQAVLSVEAAAREKLVTGLTSTGLVRELLLRLRFRFRLTTPQGQTLIESTELVLQRDLSTNETAALAKAREEDEIFRILERDVVLQMIRRFEAVSARLNPTAAPAKPQG